MVQREGAHLDRPAVANRSQAIVVAREAGLGRSLGLMSGYTVDRAHPALAHKWWPKNSSTSCST